MSIAVAGSPTARIPEVLGESGWIHAYFTDPFCRDHSGPETNPGAWQSCTGFPASSPFSLRVCVLPVFTQCLFFLKVCLEYASLLDDLASPGRKNSLAVSIKRSWLFLSSNNFRNPLYLFNYKRI